jgi:hypothetical protein
LKERTRSEEKGKLLQEVREVGWSVVFIGRQQGQWAFGVVSDGGRVL